MRPRRPSGQGGFTLIEVLVVIAVLAALAAMAAGAYQNAVRKSRRNALVADARVLFNAFTQYNVEKNMYPACCNPPDEKLDTGTLSPLTLYGYLQNASQITAKLKDRKLSSYDSPDNPTANHDFYAVMKHRSDPTITILVCDTDEYPGASGTQLYGIYLIEGSTLVPIENMPKQ